MIYRRDKKIGSSFFSGPQKKIKCSPEKREKQKNVNFYCILFPTHKNKRKNILIYKDQLFSIFLYKNPPLVCGSEKREAKKNF